MLLLLLRLVASLKLVNGDRVDLLQRLLRDNVALINRSIDLLLLCNLFDHRLLVKLCLILIGEHLLRRHLLSLLLNKLSLSLSLNFCVKLRHLGLLQGYLLRLSLLWLRHSRLLLADISHADLLRWIAHLLFNLKLFTGLLLMLLGWHADKLLEISGLGRDKNRNVAGRDLIHLELAAPGGQLIHDWSVIVSRALEINVDKKIKTRLPGYVFCQVSAI